MEFRIVWVPKSGPVCPLAGGFPSANEAAAAVIEATEVIQRHGGWLLSQPLLVQVVDEHEEDE